VRILTRYILKEILSHAVIGAALFTFVVFMRDVGRIMELVVRNSAPAAAVAEIFLFTLPTALTITIPMGVLVGVLLGLSRLAADSEITAMRATGMGAWHFVRIVAIFVFVAWGLALFNNVYLAPHSAAALAQLQDRLKTSQASFEIQPRGGVEKHFSGRHKHARPAKGHASAARPGDAARRKRTAARPRKR